MLAVVDEEDGRHFLAVAAFSGGDNCRQQGGSEAEGGKEEAADTTIK